MNCGRLFRLVKYCIKAASLLRGAAPKYSFRTYETHWRPKQMRARQQKPKDASGSGQLLSGDGRIDTRRRGERLGNAVAPRSASQESRAAAGKSDRGVHDEAREMIRAATALIAVAVLARPRLGSGGRPCVARPVRRVSSLRSVIHLSERWRLIRTAGHGLLRMRYLARRGRGIAPPGGGQRAHDLAVERGDAAPTRAGTRSLR